MIPETFATQSLKQRDQADAWRTWFEPVLEVIPPEAGTASFPAKNAIWKLDDLLISRVSAPGVRVRRTPMHVRRTPVDHWVLSYCQKGETTIQTPRRTLHAPAGIPYLWSLAEPSESVRTDAERLQIFLSRDVFRDIAPVLDAARGAVLDTPLGRLLGDFMLSLEHRLRGLEISDMPRLTAAARALIAACVAPSADRIADAKSQIDQGRLERVRQTVRTHLRSYRLGPEMICRSVGMSRSNLYRLLEGEGGVARYVLRQRLLEARAVLSDPTNTRPISAIAEELCFADPSSFGRAFRTMFGHRASEFRSAALAGMILARNPGSTMDEDEKNFTKFLSGF